MVTHQGHYQRVAASPLSRAKRQPVGRTIGLSFSPGLMRSNIEFLVDTGDQNTRTYTGAFNIDTQWVSMASTRAWATIVTGTEFFALLQAGHRVDARFKMRWMQFNVVDKDGIVLVRTTPTTAMRIMWNGNVYLIKSVDDPDDMHVELQIDGEMAGKETDIL
jgi:hypothetical protein